MELFNDQSSGYTVMKVKEQIQLWTQAENKTKALQIVVADYLECFSQLLVARNINTTEGLYSLVDELNNKWKLFITGTGINDPIQPSLFIDRLKAFVKGIDVGAYGMLLLMLKRYGHRF